MAVQWTPEQKRAIELPFGNGNILVSAAAGSGKTAVLVERIFNKINKSRVDIDSFLVVTFTNAAAAGMKNKIEERFQKELAEAESDSDADFWRMQIRLLATADITTIDSFCINVLKNNFQQIGIDSNFFIMDEAEYKLLREKIITEMFDEFYDSRDERFFELIEKYAEFRSDSRLVSLVFDIHKFISCFAEPIEWLREKSAMYSEDMENSEWTRLCIDGYIKPTAQRAAADIIELLNSILYTATGIEGDFFAMEAAADAVRKIYGRVTDSLELMYVVMSELAEIEGVDELFRWNKKYSCGENILADTMPARITPKLKEIEKFEEYMKAAKELKKRICTEISVMAFTSSEEYRAEAHGAELAKTAAELAWLVEEFDIRLTNVKRKRNSYDFGDIEHMTYELFKTNADIRQNYVNKYNEILIDEYQDTNGLQDAIFSSISKSNIFMVGDLKQSIYRFRGGDPYIFKEKSRVYKFEPDDELSGVRIDLAKNFRSRSEIIDSVNEIFDAVMSETAGDVEYSDGERLVCGMGNSADDRYRSELHIIERIKADAVEDTNIDQVEAAYIAEQIIKMHGTEFFDLKTGAVRSLNYSDFTILLRGVKNSADIYGKVFEEYGIPLMVELNDYFENAEIKIMTALISVIDNARQDVPLFTVLRSPIYNFTDSEVAYIKSRYDGGCLYERIKNCAESGVYPSERCKEVVDSINRWRGYMKQKNVASLIWTIYEETGFYDRAVLGGNGDEAQENLRLLYRRAKQYENSGFKGLFSFTKYIENLKEKRDDLPGARAIRHDTVSLMTIHKSKGLEFPVVFIGGMAKKSLTSRSDGEGRVVLHKDLGMGLMYPDTQNEIYQTTPYKQLVNAQNNREELSEKMRILYVALTRAQYKLIVTAAYNFKDETERENEHDKWNEKIHSGKMSASDVLSANRYSDWMIPAAVGGKSWEIIKTDTQEMEEEKQEDTEEKLVIDDDSELRAAVYRLLDYNYPYMKSTVIPSRTTATELKAIQHEKEKKPPHRIVTGPSFMSEKKDAAKRGTAYHNFIAYIDLDKMRDDCGSRAVREELDRLTEDGYVAKEHIDSGVVEKLAAYFNSSIGKRMLAAVEIHRESSFQTVIPSSVYDGDISGDETENMILQGVIDCYFVEKDGTTVLVDYKTDRIADGDLSEVKENYTLQLELYSKAIEQVARRSVDERYLYLFDINDAVKI